MTVRAEEDVSLIDITAMSEIKGSEYIKKMEDKYKDEYIKLFPFMKSNFHQCIPFIVDSKFVGEDHKAGELVSGVENERYLTV